MAALQIWADQRLSLYICCFEYGCLEPLTRPDCCRSNGLESKGGTAIAEKLAHLTSLQKLYLRLKRRAGALSSAAAAAASAVYVLVSSEGQGSGFLVGAAFCFPIAWRRYRAFTCPFCAVGRLWLTHVWLPGLAAITASGWMQLWRWRGRWGH